MVRSKSWAYRSDGDKVWTGGDGIITELGNILGNTDDRLDSNRNSIIYNGTKKIEVTTEWVFVLWAEHIWHIAEAKRDGYLSNKLIVHIYTHIQGVQQILRK